MVGAGVGEHSVYKTDPWGRLYRSLEVADDADLRLRARRRRGTAAARAAPRHQGRRRPGPPLLRAQPRGVLLGARDRARGRRWSSRSGSTVRSATDELDRIYDEWRRVGLMLGLREQDLPADIDGFWRRWDEIRAKLENNPVVQDVLHNGPKRRVLAAADAALVRRPQPAGDEAPARHHHLDARRRPSRDSSAWRALTPSEERRLRRVAWFTRLLGRAAPRPAALPAADLPRPPPRDGAHPHVPPARRLTSRPHPTRPGDTHDRTPRRRRRCHDHEPSGPTGSPTRWSTGSPARVFRDPGGASRPAAPRRAVRRTGDRRDPDQHRRRRRARRRDGPGRRRRLGVPAPSPTAPPWCCASTTCSSSARTRSST